ncbi:MAG: hypothetical protein ABH812_01655 [bacterium]
MYLAQLDISNPAVNPGAQFTDVSSILNIIIPLFFTSAGLIFFITLLIGALTIITASGNTEKFQTGKKRITFSIMGLIMVIASYFIIKIVEIIFGINLPL